jgi:hypothetical protein
MHFLVFLLMIEQYMITKKMVESLVNHEDMTEDEAREFIDYNATFYIEGGPIILYRLEE